MNTKKNIFFLLLCAATPFCIIGCNDNNENTAPKLINASLEPYRIELLNIAFESVSAMPVEPHIKSRSSAQESVVRVCLELDQSQRALEYIKQIGNWRQQLCYANLALYCAQSGFTKVDVQYFLNLAAQVPDNTEDWRKEQVDAKIAQTNAYMQQNKLISESFEKEIKNLEKLVLTGDFDSIQNALNIYSELYNSYYSSIDKRNLIENKIKSSWDKMPLLFRIEILNKIAGFSLDHKDQAKALELARQSMTIMNSVEWPVRSEIPLKAELAKLCFLAGDKDTARTELQKALDLFDKKREQIVNIDKGSVLRSIAETYNAVGDMTASRNIYKQAIEAGLENPNSRPRAEDLSATCCSMALNNVNPGTELLALIRQIQDILSDPW